jgi:hypothetical protein
MVRNYRISVKVGESSFEIESTNAIWIKKKEKEYFDKLFVENVSQKRGKQETKLTGEGIPPKMSLNEFYRNYVSEIKSRPIIALFLVYYLQKLQKKDTVKTSDVLNCFKEISYPNWNKLNMTDILNNAKRQALVNYVNKLWSLTTTGEDYVLNIVSGKTK